MQTIILIKKKITTELRTSEGGRHRPYRHHGPYEPYRINVGKKMWKLDYIVGVATAADSRHRGHMRDVLMKMLGDMHQDRKPFCYLMPASPDIYRPFGFRYIFDQPQYRLGSEAKECFRGGNFGWTEISVPRWPDG